MASNKKAKRFLSDDSDDEPPLSTYLPPFSPFLIIKSNDENQSICKLSPFVIEKQIQSILGTPKSVKKLRNETLLVDVHRIKVRKSGILQNTNTYILTFSSSTLPKHIRIGFEQIQVDPYIPFPLRCFKCQMFGHHIKNCKK